MLRVVEFERGQKTSRVRHRAYRVEEAASCADAAVARCVLWHGVERAGQWAVSDDGWVVECLKVSLYERHDGGLTRYRRFTVGRMMEAVRRVGCGYERASGVRFEVGPYLEQGMDKGEMVPRRWSEQEAMRARAKDAALVAASLMVARGGRLSREDWHLVGMSYRPTQKAPGATAVVFFKTAEGRTLLGTQLALIYAGMISQDDVTEMVKRVFESSLEAGRFEHALAATDRLQGIVSAPGERGGFLSGFEGLARQLPGSEATFRLLEGGERSAEGVENLGDAAGGSVPIFLERGGDAETPF